VNVAREAVIFPSFNRTFSVGGLYLAYGRALQGHRRDPGAAAFMLSCGPSLCDLSRRLLNDTWVPLPVRTFAIRDPKPRTVCETAFPDRVVHHALVAALESGVEKLLDPESYACRKGKGLHRAVGRSQEFLRVHDWALSLDIRHYFPEVPHGSLLGILHDMGVPANYLRLMGRVLDGAPGNDSPRGRSIPIGALTSQFLGNVGLDPVERCLRKDYPDCDHVRYMDDIVVFGPSKRRLWDAWRCIDDVVCGLGLTLKPAATRLVPAKEGIGFLGFRVYPGAVVPCRQTFVRIQRRVRDACAAIRDGSCEDPDRVRAGIETRLGHAAAADAGSNTRRLAMALWP
jgi:hypothetical protein